jgi:hypothetical protein
VRRLRTGWVFRGTATVGAQRSLCAVMLPGRSEREREPKGAGVFTRGVGFRVQVTPRAPVVQCHACGCNWRQPASEDEELPKCPRCDGEFVERMSIGVAARAPRPNISAEVCTFSTVASLVASYSKCTRALTLENLCQALRQVIVAQMMSADVEERRRQGDDAGDTDSSESGGGAGLGGGGDMTVAELLLNMVQNKISEVLYILTYL